MINPPLRRFAVYGKRNENEESGVGIQAVPPGCRADPGHTQWRVASSTLSACCVPKCAALDAAGVCLMSVLGSGTNARLRLSEGVPAGSARLEFEVAALELAFGGKVLQRDMVVQHLQFWAVLQHINNTV